AYRAKSVCVNSTVGAVYDRAPFVANLTLCVALVGKARGHRPRLKLRPFVKFRDEFGVSTAETLWYSFVVCAESSAISARASRCLSSWLAFDRSNTAAMTPPGLRSSMVTTFRFAALQAN